MNGLKAAAVLLSSALCLPLRAGTLEHFEKTATEKKKSKPGPAPSTARDDDEEKDGLIAELLDGLFEFQDHPSVLRIDSRALGDPTLPLLSLSARTQNVNADVRALDFQAEAGLGPLAMDVRRTQFKEDRPRDVLNVTQVHGLYRLSGSHVFELDAGLGFYGLQGRSRNSGVSFLLQIRTFPFPTPRVGFKLRPVWARIDDNGIQDFDGAVLVTWKLATLEAGFRRMRARHQNTESVLQGPYIGVSFNY
jgi:hypothetical protein